MGICTFSIKGCLARLSCLSDTFIKVSCDGFSDLDFLKLLVRDLFFSEMIVGEEHDSFYLNRLVQLEGINSRKPFICTVKQAVAFRAQDVIDNIVALIDQDYFTKASLRHQCSRNIETVFLLELCDNGGDTICLIVRSNGNRILRFRKDGREVQVYNLAEYEGYDHEIHYPDQLDDGQLVDFLPEIIAGFSRTILVHNKIHS